MRPVFPARGVAKLIDSILGRWAVVADSQSITRQAGMFGQRKRIGYIAPTVIEVVAYEFYRFAPEGIGLTGVTCSIDDWRPEEFEKGLAQVSAAATYLGSRGVDFIIHGGGPLVVARGPGYEDMIVRDVEAASKGKATTSVRAGMV